MGISVMTTHLRGLELLSGEEKIIIGPTKGLRTIVKSKDVFTAGIDDNFVEYTKKTKDKPMKRTEVQVFEQISDGLISNIISYDGDIDHLCLSQEQIISFVEGHNKWLSKIDECEWGTFFPFKVGHSYFLAAVNENSAGLFVYLFNLHQGNTLARRGHRVVVRKP